MRVRERKPARAGQYSDPVYEALLRRLSLALRSLRGARKWTQAQAAEACDMALSQYQFVERAETNVTFTTLARLARGFDVDPAALLALPAARREESE